MSSLLRAKVLLVVGIVLVLVGVAVVLLVREPGAAFGWFAYAPMADASATSGVVFLGPARRWAIAAGLLDLVAASWAFGFLVGRRRPDVAG